MNEWRNDMESSPVCAESELGTLVVVIILQNHG
jgi:hypothetical protein